MKYNKLNILAHRGLWHESCEKNTLDACEKALSLGYGIEVDVRDVDGKLMVAHDVNDVNAYPFVNLCNVLKRYPECCVAINIKSCGLQQLLKDALNKHDINNYFTFDMTVPDLLTNLKSGINSFTRQSEYEKEPVLYLHTQGVWLDMFEEDWGVTEATINHIKNGKDVAIVSPELHGNDHHFLWQKLKDILQVTTKYEKVKLYLCSDHPQSAYNFFYE